MTEILVLLNNREVHDLTRDKWIPVNGSDYVL